MRQVFCDSCKQKIEDHMYTFEPLIHICEIAEGRHDGYVDREFNLTSGRTVKFDLCIRCYNRVFGAAYKAFKDYDATE